MKKGDIIFEFLKLLKEKGELMFVEISEIDSYADEDGELLSLIKKYDLIQSKTERFDPNSYVYITDNGRNVLEFKNWDKFIESTNKEKGMTKFEIIYLACFIVFGISTMYLGYLSYRLDKSVGVLKSENDSLKSQLNSCSEDNFSLQKRIEQLKESPANDTLQTKN
jgi:cell division protein FtsB